MKSNKLRAVVLLVASAAFLFACSKGGDKDAAAKGDEAKAAAPAKAGPPKVGDSCKDSKLAANITCQGNDIIFCSSYSDHKYKKQRTCDPGTKCVPEPGGKAASCK